MINIKENEYLDKLNHSCAHLMASAIKNLYPEAKFWVGPSITEGFYYDIDLGDETVSEEDFPKIEKEMNKIRKDGKRFHKEILTKNEAFLKFKNDEYKIDLINNMPDGEEISTYSHGEFTDLCRGPHVESVKELKYFKLLKASGAYFKGDANNKMLQRIYGICFENEEDLNSHLEFLKEAKERDHRKIGKELNLFMVSEYAPGMPFFLPNGMIIKNILENYWYEIHNKEGYEFIKTPIMLNKELWEKSGHWDNYKDNMYTTSVDDKKYAIKPMNCPGGMLVYKNNLYSYKDLPKRVGELGLVHRHEASGALSGLFRVRTFTQDDAHLYMREDQIEEETTRLINLIDQIYSIFGFDYEIELSTRPEKNFIGDIEVWNKSEKLLEKIALKSGKKFSINEGDGAFYGPKLDFQIKDAIGRSWQCGTIQLDMNLPERFDLTYVDKDGSKKRPIMLHRVVYGSIERFMGILIEHYKGAFPMWLSPVQVNIIPVNKEYHLEYSEKLKENLEKNNIRVKLDDSDEKLSYKMRLSQIEKIPYTLIIGDKELDNNNISYRKYHDTKTETISDDEFINMLLKEIENKK